MCRVVSCLTYHFRHPMSSHCNNTVGVFGVLWSARLGCLGVGGVLVSCVCVFRGVCVSHLMRPMRAIVART